MIETIYWQGPGWYASRQEGAHENQRIITSYFGDDEQQPDTYGRAGTPFWLYEPPEEDENTKVR